MPRRSCLTVLPTSLCASSLSPLSRQRRNWKTLMRLTCRGPSPLQVRECFSLHISRGWVSDLSRTCNPSIWFLLLQNYPFVPIGSPSHPWWSWFHVSCPPWVLPWCSGKGSCFYFRTVLMLFSMRGASIFLPHGNPLCCPAPMLVFEYNLLMSF